MLFSCAFCSAQILIESTRSLEGKKYSINIDEQDRDLFIRLHMRDSISGLPGYQSRLDLLRQEYKKIDFKTADSIKEKILFQELHQLIEEYSCYSTYETTIPKSHYPAYDALISFLKTASTEQLERNEQNKHRMVIHGKFVTLTIVPDKKITVISPDATAYPEIYQLQHQTMEILRKEGVIPENTRLY